MEAAQEGGRRRREFQGPSVCVAAVLPKAASPSIARGRRRDTNVQLFETPRVSRDAPAARAGGFSAEAGASSGFSFDQPPVLVAGTSWVLGSFPACSCSEKAAKAQRFGSD